MRQPALLVVVALAAAGAWAAGAAPSVETLLKDAQSAWKKKDPAAAVHALENALVLARKEASLELRQVVAINHDHTGLGLYTPAQDGVVDGRRVRLYVEVANFGLTQTGETWHAQLDVEGAFTFLDTAQTPPETVQLGKRSLGTQAFETRTVLGVTSFGVELKLGDKSPAGSYGVVLTVKDAVSGKSATKEAHFVLR